MVINRLSFSVALITSLWAVAPAAEAQTAPASSSMQQATGQVTGHIVDAVTGKPVSYVSVVVQNTTRGANTDDNGDFTVTAAPGDVLVISSLGYGTQQVTVGSGSTLSIKISKTQNTLDQVVVVGYGTQRRRDVTTAVASVSGSELAKQPVLSPLQALQGKAAGVNIVLDGTPGSQPTINVRGIGSLSAGGVLYVVDGVITDNITNINSADIESMDLLKDASATAIYGSQGGNGVLIITTKHGKAGKIQVTYNGVVGIKNASNVVKLADAAAFSNYYQASTAQAPVTNQPAGNTNWYKEILRTAMQENHSVSVSGGSDNNTYLLSLGYFDDQGIVHNSDYKRYVIRLNNDYRISNRVKFGITASFTNSNNQAANTGSAFADAYRAAPVIPAMVDGKYGNTSSFGNVGNPILDLNDVDHRIYENRIEGTGYLEVKVLKDLLFRSSIGADFRTATDRMYNYAFDNSENTFDIAGGNQRSPLSTLTVNDYHSLRWVWDNTLTYNHSFGKSRLTALAGISAQQFQADGVTASRSGIAPDPSLWYINLGDRSTQQTGSGDDVNFWRRASYFGRLNYGYDGRYLLAATLREDETDRLPQNKHNIYPSASIGWIISQEKFMSTQHIFDFLKLRGGYGLVGNEAINTDATLTIPVSNFAYPFTSGTGTNGSKIISLASQDLQWENTQDIDFGLEFRSIKNHLSGEIGIYDKQVKNLFDYVKIPATSGDQDHQILENIGNVENKGLEITLNWTDQIGKDFSYHIGGNISFNKNRIVSLNGGEAVLDGFAGVQGYTTKTDNGQAIGSFYVYKAIGVFQNQDEINNYKNSAGKVIMPTANPGDLKYEDVNGDGKIDDNDRVYAGNYQPKGYANLNLGFSYKSFDFSADIYGVFGNQVYNGKQASRQLASDNVESSVAYGRWTPGSGIENQPSANIGIGLPSTYFISSGSFVRLNNITLGYTLPASLYKRVKFKNLRVYITSQYLLTLKKYSGFTAEIPGASPTSSGIENSTYPTSRIIAIGVNVGL